MRDLTPSQLKALSEFLNTVAAAWFTAGVITPLSINLDDLLKVLFLAGTAIIFSLLFLAGSLYLVRKVK